MEFFEPSSTHTCEFSRVRGWRGRQKTVSWVTCHQLVSVTCIGITAVGKHTAEHASETTTTSTWCADCHLPRHSALDNINCSSSVGSGKTGTVHTVSIKNNTLVGLAEMNLTSLKQSLKHHESSPNSIRTKYVNLRTPPRRGRSTPIPLLFPTIIDAYRIARARQTSFWSVTCAH